ncbi:MAG TPA: bifunctional demethylmenaquinone methyltransferase/2-methoxy-6-polyprenyl-1,4-benzoquinol methylase UbiE [Bacteroidales bacterium]|nr:bifunctional demethylmenaquinone methyltransferase/2-methoxy-6-polyprenyl-1,4-benzoquinol methylase UbiE [Bacteroidales bacterium]HXK82361.1 bifunctional demethylmenaquinone methyltransferase/2-methoxy-6-polyprenyl-1,4-benzoquinol methylase UbiE [Bacteroidales bacterium]
MSAEHKQNEINQMFNHISKDYDLVNSLLTFGIDKFWRKFFIKAIKNDKYPVILDIACGAGELGKYLIKFDSTKIIGLDPSPKMIEKAKNRYANFKTEYIVGYAESLPLQDKSVNLITIAFGVRNFADIEKSLSEIYRVLAKNGRCAILEFTIPSNKIFKFFYLNYLNFVIPVLGGLLSNNIKAYRYLRDSILEFNKNVILNEKLRQKGFSVEKIKPLTGGIVTYYIAKK